MKQKEIFISLKDKNKINEVFRYGKKIYSKNLLVRYIQLPDQEFFPLRIVWAVPRKVKTAPQRNRLKRIMRHALFLAGKDFSISKIKKSYVLAFIPRPEFNDIDEKPRKEEMKFILKTLSNVK